MLPVFLAISGSLRRISTNTTLLEALADLAPPGVDIVLYRELATLPAFNPDVEMQGEEALPAPVQAFRRALQQAAAVIVSSPEYAHGVPGALKNALDWVVGTGELVGKPVALLNPSPASHFAHPSLAETLRVMSARLVEPACLTLPLAGKKLDRAQIAASDVFRGPLLAALAALAEATGASAETL
jgi:NAD(P)H-dependent FMN reductase